ncbi:MAG: efflux RND transporter permease subunit [Candidatus Dojkabacteria bacterium]|nr:efflux RND transporter permease subunit [Candidatus Dojkabacteria bacterium]MDQ7020522.1 efflux RND transporter permease subunit [Candidatus Dojkabacteria bacterium]
MSKEIKQSRLRSSLAGFSSAFANKARVTLLLFIAILAGGYISYTSGLTREGFPSVEIPIGIVTADYKINDESVVLEEVTRPLEVALSSVDEINQLFTYTTGDGMSLVAYLDTDISNKDGIKLIRDELAGVNLPDNVELEFETLKASAVAEKYDLLFTINANKKTPVEEQVEVAKTIALEIEKREEVSLAEARSIFEDKLDFQTGEVNSEQVTFQRVGNRVNDGSFSFKDGVAIGVIKSSDDIGTIDISEAVRETLDNLDTDIKDNYTFTIGSGDFAKELNRNIDSLESNAFSGIIAVVIISLLFVSWRASIITAIFIPTVLASTFITLNLLGMTLNIISLFALILVLGLLVDDAIVVIEAIDKKLKSGKSKIVAIKESVYEIGPADVSGTITTVLVFTPFLFISGIYGDFIVPIPMTVVLTLLLSLVIALSIIPFLSVLILSSKTESKDNNGVLSKIDAFINAPSRFVITLSDKVSKFVDMYLSKKIYTFIVMILTIIAIGLGMSSVSKIDNAQFPPPKDGDYINIVIDYPNDIEFSEVEEITEEVENIITTTIDTSLVESASYIIANKDMAFLDFLLVSYNDRNVTHLELTDQLTQVFESYPRATVQATASSADGSGLGYDFIAQVYADEGANIEIGYDALVEYIENYDFGESVDILDISKSATGLIARKDGRRFGEISIAFKYDDENIDIAPLVDNLEASIKKDFDESKLETLGLSKDAIDFDQGFNDDAEEAFAAMTVALFIALILMFALLVLQFNSYIQTFLVMLAIPLSFPLLFPGLLLTDNSFSFFVQLGIAGLIGIVVNNTIMLLDFANQERDKGKSIREAIVGALNSRFRALITTSATTVLGLLPLALSDPFWEGLAYTIVFGIISSTVLVIFAFPAFYYSIESLKAKMYSKIGTILKEVN